nr:MAG TPA: Cell-membrane associated Mucin15 [Bacteriophage sp.]
MTNRRLSIIGIITGMLGACFGIIAIIMRLFR